MNKDVCYADNTLLNMLKQTSEFICVCVCVKGAKQNSQEGKFQDKVHVKI